MIFGNNEEKNLADKEEFTQQDDKEDVAKPYQTVDEGLTTDTTDFEPVTDNEETQKLSASE
jgi:hypothetical protein